LGGGECGLWTIPKPRLRRTLTTVNGGSGRFDEDEETLDLSVLVTPSALEKFTPRELTAAYEDFTKRGLQYLNTETGFRAAAYWFGGRILMVYQESEKDVVVLIHPTLGIDSLRGSDQPPENFPYPLPTDTRL
jgi:hypothetical protein